MTPLKRRVAAVSAPLLLALSLTACGGSSDSAADSPEDASTDDFCGVFSDFSDDADDIEDDDYDAQASLLNDLADEWISIGTPEDANEEQRAGFVVVMDAWSDLSGSDMEAIGDDSSGAGELGISADDEDSAEQFLTYAGTTCADEIADTEE